MKGRRLKSSRSSDIARRVSHPGHCCCPWRVLHKVPREEGPLRLLRSSQRLPQHVESSYCGSLEMPRRITRRATARREVPGLGGGEERRDVLDVAELVVHLNPFRSPTTAPLNRSESGDRRLNSRLGNDEDERLVVNREVVTGQVRGPDDVVGRVAVVDERVYGEFPRGATIAEGIPLDDRDVFERVI